MLCVSMSLYDTQYTLILTASKCMPKQCLDFASRKSKPRKTVGIRMPDHPVCRAITDQLDRPLLCSSVHTEDDVVVDDSSVMLPDPALLFDAYAGRGLDFMVSDGLASWTAGMSFCFRRVMVGGGIARLGAPVYSTHRVDDC